ncbi:MAG: UDP-N-acetylmuramoyl-L-alanyl-D-glutamate--2,6-diaminopimelate ligase [Acidimicrobiia bacterium]
MELQALLDDSRALAPLARYDVHGDSALEIVEASMDSRTVTPQSLFFCVPGAATDGHRFADAAVDSGAAALVVERRLDVAVTQVVVPDVRLVIGPLCATLHGRPSERLDVVGITGTNGKTTTAQLLGDLLRADERRVEVYGTLDGGHTTPEAPVLQRRLREAVAAGASAVVMEVSSHALAQHRVDGTRFRVGVFTNLSRDHLDFHESMERYFDAKARLFERSLSSAGVICADDPHGRLLIDTATIPVRAYALGDVEALTLDRTSSSFVWRGHPVRLPLAGRFNVLNALAAASAASELGMADAAIASALAHVNPVAGRFETIDAGQAFRVVVDYAHTPDGLSEVLSAASETTPGSLIVVFGCGGDRDATKRPAMGETAARIADRVVLTSDNPRSEDPDAIISAVRAGIPAEGRIDILIEPDRRRAIALALASAGAGDTVVIAGKGHETTQTIGDQVVPFDDRVVARELLEAGR